MVRSLTQTLAYYEASGRTWERAALLKARPIAGDLELGRELIASLRPFVYPRSLDLGAVDALRSLKAQIDLRGQDRRDDVKLGPGGIREVEFFVNALQLVHGGKDASLREQNTLRALRRLVRTGLVSDPDADRLEEAYTFLRRVENRLQMREERQTHVLPGDPVETQWIARGLGFADVASLRETLEGHRRFVKDAFGRLLGQAARQELPRRARAGAGAGSRAAARERLAALRARGFEEPERALDAIGRLARVRGSPFAETAMGPRPEAVTLLSALSDTPDPDQALLLFSEFMQRLTAPEGYLSLLTRSSRSGPPASSTCSAAASISRAR